MLLKLQPTTPLPTLEKRVGGCDVSDKGAFFARDILVFTAKVPRPLGAVGVVLRIGADGAPDKDMAFSFVSTQNGTDTYRLSLPLAPLTASRGHGLFYYEVLFLRGKDTLFTSTLDNVNFTLSPHSAGRFSLVVSKDGFDTPHDFCGKTMYHIFVDRFAPRGGKRPEGAVYHKQWHEEIEQYGAYPGAPVPNTEFFGGTLWGIIDKLDYLEELGVGVLYLSPIFKATSNHKYDTGNYEEVDPQFGGEEALRQLLDACHARGISVVLDGVFNHTGDDSLYFNRYGRYKSVGAYQSKDSAYADWFYFKNFPDTYESWWGIPILPKLKQGNPAVQDYFVGKGGIVEKYTKMGVDGWRLDVVDELPDRFVDELRARVKENTDGRGVVIGEVWEYAHDKIAYSDRRRYFEGDQLDSVMNYPLRKAILGFVKEGDGATLSHTLCRLWGSYPTAVCHALMNILSTHDTERILTVLGGEPDDGRYTNAELRTLRMPKEALERAKERLKMAAAIQFTVFGVPSVFYGDEAGMEGYHDPFCRRPYPWGREDSDLLDFYRTLGAFRRESAVLARGEFALLPTPADAIAYQRGEGKGAVILVANRGEKPLYFALPNGKWRAMGSKKAVSREISLAPDTFFLARRV